MNLPTGAKKIVEARLKGFKPDEMIIVSIVGRINEPNHTIFANPNGEYDWQFLTGLQVCVYTDEATPWLPTVMNIAKVKPVFLGLWDAERHEGADVWYLPDAATIDKPKTQWRWKIDFLPWLPFQNREFACA